VRWNGCSCRRLLRKERALALNTPAVAGKRAIASDDPVARDGQGDRVGSAGICNSPNSAGFADTVGERPVGHDGPEWNPEQSLPDALLEWRAANVERQVEAFRRRLDEAQDFPEIIAQLPIIPDELAVGEPRCKIALQLW
jgi:hypothetical protein